VNTPVLLAKSQDPSGRFGSIRRRFPVKVSWGAGRGARGSVLSVGPFGIPIQVPGQGR